ncbi:hypothetical protein U5A82_19390 [Sphingobium sp. CR2-8]|uniref:hypothetical protein n=1 Tax=Sphingobium sp. CR2-8 TaxID=1306534 RepID=UPI002DB5CDFC|nr:hypothetical protein [Sphingobium sp. CR2-8]MEC3912557.1 hypothetical protein [Sphingobium sp. CR2-8]
MTDPVGDAVNTVHEKLDTSGWFDTVTNGETKDIVGALTALPADQADQVVDRLQQSGELDQVAHEVMDGDWFCNGGLSGDERRAFFADMAGKLDGQSLAALSDSFPASGTQEDPARSHLMERVRAANAVRHYIHVQVLGRATCALMGHQLTLLHSAPARPIARSPSAWRMRARYRTAHAGGDISRMRL